MVDSRSVLVTGAAGYIGSRVTAELVDAGHEVTPIDDFSEGDVERIRGVDVRDVEVGEAPVEDRIEEVDAVMHLAGVTGVEACGSDERAAFENNVRRTEEIAWHCRDHGTPLVFPCSMATIGDPVETPITSDHPREPLNFYGVNKAMSEQDITWLARDSYPAHIYLKSNLYGHHEVAGRTVGKSTVINIFVERALAGEPLSVHEPGTQARDFVHVKDVARAYRLSLETLADADTDGAETFPIASGDCRSVIEIAETVQRVVDEERGERPEIEMVENPRGSETVSGDFTVDTDEARDAIGFEAEYTVERAIREMVS